MAPVKSNGRDLDHNRLFCREIVNVGHPAPAPREFLIADGTACYSTDLPLHPLTLGFLEHKRKNAPHSKSQTRILSLAHR